MIGSSRGNFQEFIGNWIFPRALDLNFNLIECLLWVIVTVSDDQYSP